MRGPLLEIDIPLIFQSVEIDVSLGLHEERKGFQKVSKRYILGQSYGDVIIILASAARAKVPTISLGYTFMYVDQPQGLQCALALRAVVQGEMLATACFAFRAMVEMETSSSRLCGWLSNAATHTITKITYSDSSQ